MQDGDTQATMTVANNRDVGPRLRCLRNSEETHEYQTQVNPNKDARVRLQTAPKLLSGYTPSTAERARTTRKIKKRTSGSDVLGGDDGLTLHNHTHNTNVTSENKNHNNLGAIAGNRKLLENNNGGSQQRRNPQ